MSAPTSLTPEEQRLLRKAERDFRNDLIHRLDVQADAARREQMERDIKAICSSCREGVPIHKREGMTSLWHVAFGRNIHTVECKAAAIRQQGER